MTSQRYIYKATILFLFISLLHDTNSSSIASGNNTLRFKRQSCEFSCDNGECISEFSVCDGQKDCTDGSDETRKLCSIQPCPSFLFRCDYGACINRNKECDKKQDCADNSDETGCTTQSSCGSAEFRCKDGECINDFDICDGVPTCKDGSDETVEACGPLKCPQFTYRCAYGACVDRGAKCNGKLDCADGSDEAGCPGGKPVTSPTPTPPPDTTPTSPIPGGCLLPDHPANGKFNVNGGSGSYSPNTQIASSSSISLICHPGYQKQGSEKLYCIQGGWVGGEVHNQRCSRVCPLPNEDDTVVATCFKENVIVDCSKAVDGTQASTKCAPFFKDAYNYRRPIMTCTNGDWKPKLGVCTPECGLKRVNAQTLVIGGTPAVEGEYPWLVAVYNAKDQHICGGSIISRQYVLSAAHCFTDQEGNRFEPSAFTIIGGKYYRPMHDPRDTHTQVRKIEKIFVHDDYLGTIRNYQNDVAVAKMKEAFQLTTHVQPVCIDAADDIDLVENNNGVVSGWGYTQEGGVPSELLKKVVLPYQSKITCQEHLTKDFYQRFFTPDKFCAGFVDRQTSVCNGDSGGGFYMNRYGNFFVRGIVSLSSTSNVGCNSNNFALYTRVSKFEKWIFDITGGLQ